MAWQFVTNAWYDFTVSWWHSEHIMKRWVTVMSDGIEIDVLSKDAVLFIVYKSLGIGE